MFHFILPKFILNIERWKWNDEYRVYVSNMGHFKDEHKKSLLSLVGDRGYVLIKTNCGFKRAHRLVMFTWAPIPNAESLTVDHLDHNKRNNALSNLEWVTKEENQKRAEKDYVKAEKKENTKVVCIEENKCFKTIPEAAQWLIDTKFSNSPITTKTKGRVETRISMAIKNKKVYNDYHWERQVK